MLDNNISIKIPEEQLKEFSQKWGVTEVALFGSALRDDFGPDSDVDVLVSFMSGIRHGLFNLVRMQNELEGIFGRKVDLLTRRGVEASRNPIRRKAILDSATVIYAT